jgi:hypothetical protein
MENENDFSKTGSKMARLNTVIVFASISCTILITLLIYLALY